MFAVKHVACSDDLRWRFAARGDASRFLRTSFAVAVFLVCLAFCRLLRPATVRTAMMSVQTMPKAEALALSRRTDAQLAFTGDKRSLLRRHGEALYGFEGLCAYKDKFSPDWEPRFIAGPLIAVRKP